MAEFDRGIELFKKDIEKKAVQLTKMLSKVAFQRLILNSPIPGIAEYSKGSYVLSHRIVVDGQGDVSPTYTLLPDASAPARALANELPKLSQVKFGSIVQITNNIAHGSIVEFIGWIHRGPYMTYNLTKAEMKAFL